MNTRTLAAYAMAATMIGGSLVGATALLASGDATSANEVQVVEAEPEPVTVGADTPSIPMATPSAPPVPVTTPEGNLQAGGPGYPREHEHDHDEDDREHDDRDEDRDEDDHDD